MSAAIDAPPPSEPEPMLGLAGIAAVERDTGLSKDTLRIWERRYGFPAPLRDEVGDRVYPVEQVQRLRLLKRLIDAGHRAGRVVPATLDTLQQLSQDGARKPLAGPERRGEIPQDETIEACLQMLRLHQVEELRRLLTQALLRQGLGGFVQQLVAPLTTRVGDAWMRGELEVFEEHIYTELIQQLLRQAVQGLAQQSLRVPAERPRVLLSTLPGEPHGLGLLMAESMLVVEGCQCLSLGVQTPLEALPRASLAHASDIVALSFSGLMSSAAVKRGLSELRAALPPAVQLWAGGSALLLRRRDPQVPGIRCMTDLGELPAAVAAWRTLQVSGNVDE
ncbi:MerR family transcriptional regulator [Paucibacter sp. AS339]|uniref:MerR family transcriptional regulator n=1 Tax=Paucibacter hankyongi TaxID=3133434 RepID=UPI0030B1A241